ncbi:hypothetical protein ACV337_31475, partial [Pseudomonas aeruginosa]
DNGSKSSRKRCSMPSLSSGESPAKRRFLEAVAARLAPAAPLLLANLMEARDAFERPVQAEACRLAGLS